MQTDRLKNIYFNEPMIDLKSKEPNTRHQMCSHNNYCFVLKKKDNMLLHKLMSVSPHINL